jgi:hypothetical protein
MPVEKVRFRSLSIAILLATALALGVTACGDSDDSGGSSGAAASTDEGGTSANGAKPSDEQQIRTTFRAVTDSFESGDGKTFCASVTPAALKQVESLAIGLQVEGCEAMIAQLAKQTKAANVKQRPAKVVSVKVKGRRATMVIRDGGRPPSSVRFRKVDGMWQLSDPGITSGGNKDQPAPPPQQQTS